MTRIAPGAQIGPYEIISFIAAGGMGEVYRARDPRLARPVAIKVLPEEMFGDSDAVHRFEREARAAAAVAHPNLISIHDVGRTGEIHYLVMDLLEGQTLRQRLAGGPLQWMQATELTRAIVEGMIAVHGKGFVHRDLKPENVFLTSEGWVKVLDFGLAVPRLPIATPSGDDEPTMRAITQKGMVVGTIDYMSPEQLRGDPVDAGTDIFAMGCVLYEMICGEAPFARPSRAETIAAILSNVEIVVPEAVPEALRRIIRRCLERTRDRRYHSAGELADALRLVGDTRPLPESVPPEESSIAVLPFANLTGDRENDYFIDGLSEEILNALTRLPGLRVTARTSAFAFRGKEQDIRRIGEALGVRTILEGGVRRSGNRIRVTAQLVDTSTGYQLWSARYDKAMTDVFAVQDEIAAAIVDTLELRLAPRKKSAVRHTPPMDAYHAHLKSRYHFSKLTPERLARSQAYAEEAIALDPEYPAAQSGLAECFIQAAIYGLKPAREMIPLARAAASKAVALDPREPAAHMTLARIAGEFDLDWTEALRQCRLALECESITPAVRALCAQFVLWPLGRIEELIAAIQPALKADPLSPMPRFVLAQALLAQGSRERAVAEVEGVLELHEHFWPAHLALSIIHTDLGRTSDAIAALEKTLRVAPWEASAIGMLAGNFTLAGDRERADQMLARVSAPQFEPLRPLAQSSFHFVLGDFERFAQEYETMIEQRYPVAAYYFTWLSLFERFRESEPGRLLREKLHLPDSRLGGQ
jgi:serine/threonine protein kinase/tetratricopeptide (TPR) repeat protein